MVTQEQMLALSFCVYRARELAGSTEQMEKVEAASTALRTLKVTAVDPLELSVEDEATLTAAAEIIENWLESHGDRAGSAGVKLAADHLWKALGVTIVEES